MKVIMKSPNNIYLFIFIFYISTQYNTTKYWPGFNSRDVKSLRSAIDVPVVPLYAPPILKVAFFGTRYEDIIIDKQ